MSRQQSQRVAIWAITAVAILVILPIVVVILFVIINGLSAMSWEFLSQPPRNGMREGGVFPAILGTILLTLGTAVAAIPLGIGAAIYLAEYAPDNRFTRMIRLAIVNLAGIPSIVYGLFGLGAFVLFLNFGTSILAGSLTLGLMTLPVVISTAEEAILAVPQEFRTVSLSLGATRWQTIRHQVLPHALPGIIEKPPPGRPERPQAARRQPEQPEAAVDNPDASVPVDAPDAIEVPNAPVSAPSLELPDNPPN
jgi:phosphate transport system permease protein